MFLTWNPRHRAPAAVGFYCTRLLRFRQEFNYRNLATLTPLEIDEHLARAGISMSVSTRRHDVVALQVYVNGKWADHQRAVR
jgi:hypothetical protein